MAIAPIPLPHWLIWGHPAIETASNRVHRAVTSLAVAFWRSGCITLPTDDPSLAALVRMPIQHWTPLKSAAFTALSEILPALETDHGKRLTARINKSRSGHELSARATLARKLKSGPAYPFTIPQRDVDTPTPRPPAAHAINGSVNGGQNSGHGRKSTDAASKVKPATFTD